MTQPGRLRRSSLELHPASAAAAACYQGAPNGAFGPSLGQQEALSLLLAASAPDGFMPQSTAGLAGKAQSSFLASAPADSNGYDPGLLEAEEPGPLPCLPRNGRMLGGAGYSNGNTMLLQQPLQGFQQAGLPGAGLSGQVGGRQARPRRHSVTIGMLNEHQQQQQAAAYAAALAAAQHGGMPAGLHPPAPGAPPGGAGGLGMLGPLPPTQQMHHQQQQQQPPRSAAVSSPAKQQLQALGNMQAAAAAAAAQLGMGPASLLVGLQSEQLQSLNGGSIASNSSTAVMPMGVGEIMDFRAQYSMNAPRLPNAGGCRRHSWAPTTVNGSMAYAQALLLQQQRQLAAAAALGDARGLLGLNGTAGPGSYSNGSLLNGHAAGSGPPSGSFAGLSGAAAVAAAAAAACLPGLQGSPSALTGFAGGDAASDQQRLAQHLLQLHQQAGLGGAQQALGPYVEALLESGQALGPPPALPGLGSVAASPFPAVCTGLVPGAAAAPMHLSQLAFDTDSLSPAAAAAAANMYAPLQINGVTLDSQLLVSPFADNWDMMNTQGPAGLTPQQLAAAAAGQHLGYGVVSPRAGVVPVQPHMPANGSNGKAHKGLPARSGSCSSTTSSTSNGNGNGHGHSHHNGYSSSSVSSSGPLPTVPLPVSNGNGSKGSLATAGSSSSSTGSSGSSTTTAAALTAASMVATLPPPTKVCSDAPWDLRKAAEEDAKVLAAQQAQVQKLMQALEHSKSLELAREAQGSAASVSIAASDAGKDSSSSSAERMQPVLFGYQLPDTGADAWGGSSSTATVNTPGGGCISQEPSNKLFVGNIGWWVTEEDLLHWFSRFGTVVNVKIMYNSRKMHKPKDKWRSREYGFIDYATPEEAAKAIVWMDGVELPDLMKDTCGIIVQYAKPASSGSGNGHDGSSNGIGSAA